MYLYHNMVSGQESMADIVQVYFYFFDFIGNNRLRVRITAPVFYPEYFGPDQLLETCHFNNRGIIVIRFYRIGIYIDEFNNDIVIGGCRGNKQIGS